MNPREPIRIEIADQGARGNSWGNSVGHAMMLMRLMQATEPTVIPPKPKTQVVCDPKPVLPLKQRRKMLERNWNNERPTTAS